MTDPTHGAAAPPKKRAFGFKKAAWQLAPKTEGRDMFSHSNEFRDIVAEETKRKNAEKKKAEEEARKRKADEERERKRRKVSVEPTERVRGSGSGGSARAQRASSGRSKTPASPTPYGSPAEDTLATRYDAMTKPSSSNGAVRNDSQEVIDLGDTDDEHDHSPYKPSPSPAALWNDDNDYSPYNGAPSPAAPNADAAVHLPYRASPGLTALDHQSTPQSAQKEQVPTPTPSSQPPKPSAVVQLLIVSEIPNTRPLIVKVKTDSTLSLPKEAWCGKQGFTPEQTRSIFMTWRKSRIYDSTKIERLGIKIDHAGFVTVDGDHTIYDDENLPKIQVDAWTEELFKLRKKADALEAARAADAIVVVEEPEPEPEPEPQAKQFRLILKAKGREDFKIKARGSTEFGHLADAYKNALGIPQTQPVTLMFDGERLKPIDTIGDSDIDDLDSIEVHFK